MGLCQILVKKTLKEGVGSKCEDGERGSPQKKPKYSRKNVQVKKK